MLISQLSNIIKSMFDRTFCTSDADRIWYSYEAFCASLDQFYNDETDTYSPYGILLMKTAYRDMMYSFSFNGLEFVLITVHCVCLMIGNSLNRRLRSRFMTWKGSTELH